MTLYYKPTQVHALAQAMTYMSIGNVVNNSIDSSNILSFSNCNAQLLHLEAWGWFTWTQFSKDLQAFKVLKNKQSS
jgi:hypothetical protein